MKTVAFHSYKGGTGKTSLAVNLSAMLGKDVSNSKNPLKDEIRYKRKDS